MTTDGSLRGLPVTDGPLRLEDGSSPEDIGDWIMFCVLWNREKYRREQAAAGTSVPYEVARLGALAVYGLDVPLASACGCGGNLHPQCRVSGSEEPLAAAPGRCPICDHYWSWHREQGCAAPYCSCPENEGAPDETSASADGAQP